MSYTYTVLIIVYVVVALFLAYIPKEDLEFSAWIVALLMLIVIFAVSVDEIWRVFDVLHPVVVLALVGVVVFFISLAGQPIGFSMPYLVIFVTIALPMLVISLCINVRGL
ncbi:hypothetical protein CTI12_AA590050 [Artemisia annua]|uniref:Uncharacterized protein n=1 Tax=Artemisia annua TaxID=35608 RepID=A0A2U1KL48_ARTAN|nr:hypothetical protein CTI12_AA595080 [Artemisia annua]PWA37485.1 hypothetical protein CTI12_AA590050 [Artemisia annua]